MNKRARNRLIGVTAIIVIIGIAVILGAGSRDGAYSRTVSDVVGDSTLVGERVRVSGAVVQGSWNRESNPMEFEIRDETATTDDGPSIKVVYNGGVPSTFGDGVVAIITGELGADGTINTDDMITKCPSKYESAKGALSVASLLADGAAVGKPVPVTGYVVGTIQPPGGASRFAIADSADGSGDALPVFYEGALPAGMVEGSQVVLGGALGEDGTYAATSVAMSDTEK